MPPGFLPASGTTNRIRKPKMPKSKVHLSSFAFFEATATPMKTVKFGLEMGLLQKFQ